MLPLSLILLHIYFTADSRGEDQLRHGQQPSLHFDCAGVNLSLKQPFQGHTYALGENASFGDARDIEVEWTVTCPDARISAFVISLEMNGVSWIIDQALLAHTSCSEDDGCFALWGGRLRAGEGCFVALIRLRWGHSCVQESEPVSFCVERKPIAHLAAGFPEGVQCSNQFCPCQHDASCHNPEAQGACALFRNDKLSADQIRMDAYLKQFYTAAGLTTEDSTAELVNSSNLSMPIYIMNHPSRSDRASHMRMLLDIVGFQNTTFPRITISDDISFDQSIEDGWATPEGIEYMTNVGWIGPSSVKAYLANAIDQIKTIRQAAMSAFPIFGIFEDDLLPLFEPSEVRRRITMALKELPESADMLYLEYCHERCADLCFSSEHEYIARARSPKCSAAILYTSKGSRRLSSLCKPVFTGIDNMYPALIERGLIEAYVMVPPIFAQDGLWGSNANRVAHLTSAGVLKASRHVPAAVPCMEDEHLFKRLGADFEIASVHYLEGGILPLILPQSLLNESIILNRCLADIKSEVGVILLPPSLAHAPETTTYYTHIIKRNVVLYQWDDQAEHDEYDFLSCHMPGETVRFFCILPFHPCWNATRCQIYTRVGKEDSNNITEELQIFADLLVFEGIRIH